MIREAEIAEDGHDWGLQFTSHGKNNSTMFSRIKKLLTPHKPEFSLTAWPEDRGYDLFAPDGAGPFPLVIAIHGYTHDGPKMRNLTSSTGDPSHPDSLDSLAAREKFAVAYPNGTSISMMPGRCWNAGGGVNGYAPVGEPAQSQGVDDLKYFQDLLDDINNRASVDPSRVYLLGISNGGAMAQRLAMESPENWAAVATVAGCNQHAAASGVKPKAPVPLLHIHGTKDPVWPYSGGPFGQSGLMVSVEESLAVWTEANGAELLEETQVSDIVHEDGCEVLLSRYRGTSQRCDVDFYKVVGGGHAWPSGQRYLPKPIIGHTTDIISTNKVAWTFFQGRRAP
jgi:polyhydroxybutyrate depolymerase